MAEAFCLPPDVRERRPVTLDFVVANYHEFLYRSLTVGRKPNAVPSYLKHRTGQAFVKVQGKNHYLGLYGSPESRVAYTKFLAQLGQSTTPPPTKEIRSEGITITEALIAYWRWTEDRFKKHRGDARAANDIKMALRLLRQKYGDKPLAKLVDYAP